MPVSGFRMYLYAGKLPGSRQGLVRVFQSHFPIKGFHPPQRFRLPAGMVDHSNPIVIAQDFCTCAVQELGIQRTCLSFNSGDGEALARHKWSVHVRLPCCPYSLASRDSTGRCRLSWEYFTTFDYEWSVIQGRRPYRWTIWVCTEQH